jgi:LemA protein
MLMLTPYRLPAMCLAAFSLWGCSYGELAEQDRVVKAEWAQLQDAVNERNELVLGLVRTMKTRGSGSEGVWRAAEDSGARLASAHTAVETIDAANRQSAALTRLLAAVENDLQLKDDESTKRLLAQLADTENRIAVERMRYNAFVQQYNVRRRQFPGVQVSRLFNFVGYPFFEVPAQ